MPSKPIIHLYCLCWNEAWLIPFFLGHYGDLIDRFFIYDNGSTDGSLELLAADPRITVEHFDSGDSFVLKEKEISDTVWRRSTGVADWVFMIDMDEFIFHPDLIGLLNRCAQKGVTAIEAITFNMVADDFPDPARPLTEQVTLGVRCSETKLCIFDPAAIARTNYAPGRHSSAPEGRVRYPARRPVLLLHYKRLGLSHYLQRNRRLQAGLRPRDLDNKWGENYTWPFEAMTKEYEHLRQQRVPVPGLSGGSDFDRFMDDERLIGESGLFDAAWYLEQNPDIRGRGDDPLAHFLAHGWKEGRRPNAALDLTAYQQRQAEQIPPGTISLLHYIRNGGAAA